MQNKNIVQHRVTIDNPTLIHKVFQGGQSVINKQVEVDPDKNLQKFVELLAEETVEQEEIQRLAWGGIRAKIWRYLLRYVSGNRSQATVVMEKKRNDYRKFVMTYLPVFDLERIDCQANRKTAKIIQVDVKRTLPEAKMVRAQKPQEVLTRALYIWHVKHPASGYVQGISDLVIPFFLVFLNEYTPVNLNILDETVRLDIIDEETWWHIEADIYWCISRMLDSVASNYVRGFGGIKESFRIFEQLLLQIDPELHRYLQKTGIDLFCLTFRDISTFLLRMFTPKVGIRLFDTYIACGDSYPTFTLYLLIAIMVKFSSQYKKMNFENIMRFMQKPPTKQWNEKELEMVISQAYVYRTHYTVKETNES